ncbi:hypothetical protein GQ457_04G019260 [Hibiscus cannabinus]
MKVMVDQFVMNLKQEQFVVQAVAASSKAPIEKLLQHRGYPFVGTIKEKPEEAEYWLEPLSWWETTALTAPAKKITWKFFVEEFKKKYIREQHLDAREKKFLYLKQGSEPIVYHVEGRDNENSPEQILEREIKRIRNKSVPLVKVLWKNHGVEEVTWETEATMQEQYPHLFDSGKNSRTNSLFKGKGIVISSNRPIRTLNYD